MKIITFLFLVVVLVFAVHVGLVVLNTVSSQYLSDFQYFWETVSDNTFLNESGLLNLSLQRISTEYDATLKVSYEGGNSSTDDVYLNGYHIGNLSGTSPDTFTVSSLYLTVTTEINYTIDAAQTNITQTNLTYYRYDGCNYDETTCKSLYVIDNSTKYVMFPMAYLPLLLIAVGLILVGGGMLVR